MAFKPRSSYARKSTRSRQRTARRNQVRMSRAGYGASARTRFSRILSTVPSRHSAEVKLVDTVNGSPTITSVINTTGTITAMNLIQSGSGFNNRVGRRIEMKSVHLVGILKQTGTVNVSNDYGRVVVVYDRQPNGALPAITTILLQYDQSSTTSTTAFSGLNPDQRERFMIVADEHIALPSVVAASGLTGGVDGLSVTFNINRFIKLRNLTTHFQHDSNPAVIGDVATGALYVFTLGAFASGSEGWNASLSWRLRYVDT